MNQQDISNALAKQVPDMKSRGFIIGTACGEMNVPPGWIADRIAENVERTLQAELLYLTRQYQHGRTIGRAKGDL